MKKLEKNELCGMKEISDEEGKIAEKLHQFQNKISFPMLDIGSWSWKISSIAFWDKHIIHIDPLQFSDNDFKLPDNHTRILGDFFNYKNNDQIKTLLFCHSLQYIDYKGIETVVKKIKEINPEYVLLVINKNDWIVGESLRFFKENQRHENGERHFTEFPGKTFSLIDSSEVTGTFFCKDKKEATNTICRLLLDTMISNEQEEKMIRFLEEKTIQWSFDVNQDILLYKNNTLHNE